MSRNNWPILTNGDSEGDGDGEVGSGKQARQEAARNAISSMGEAGGLAAARLACWGDMLKAPRPKPYCHCPYQV